MQSNIDFLEKMAHKMATFNYSKRNTTLIPKPVTRAPVHEEDEEVPESCRNFLKDFQTAPLKNRPFAPASHQKRHSAFNNN